jgi:hypothetical protein
MDVNIETLIWNIPFIPFLPFNLMQQFSVIEYNVIATPWEA